MQKHVDRLQQTMDCIDKVNALGVRTLISPQERDAAVKLLKNVLNIELNAIGDEVNKYVAAHQAAQQQQQQQPAQQQPPTQPADQPPAPTQN